MRIIILSLCWLSLIATPALAQQEMRSATKGSSTPLPITGTAIDPDTTGAWSTAAIDALEVGGIETAAVSTRLQDVHVYVEYTDAVASSNGSLMLMGVGQ